MNASLFRHAMHIAAILGLYLSAAMLIPAMLDLYYGHSDWQVFAAAAFVTS
ncbi:TrkH family potassium uptake protein, partial [Sinorhizobium meliloti]